MSGLHAKTERENGELRLSALEGYCGRLERIIEETADAINDRRHAAQGTDPLARKIMQRMREAR